MLPLSSFLRRLAWDLVLAGKYSLKDFSELFKRIKGFLEKAPISYFQDSKLGGFKGTPLTLTDDALAIFKNDIQDLDLIRSGLASYNELNIPYLLGKLFNKLYMAFDVKISDTSYSSQGRTLISEFNKIWDGATSEQGMVFHYKGKFQEEACKMIANKLNSSAEIIEKKMIPLVAQIERDYPDKKAYM